MQQERNLAAMKLALRHYYTEMRHTWYLTAPAMLLPGIGAILTQYVPPLIIARLLTNLSKSHNISFSSFIPYILFFTVVWAIGEILWRISGQFLAMAEIRGLNNLYNNALGFLLEKDLDFFHDNFAGSLTKKALGYARRYEEFLDTMSFTVAPDLLPLIFVVFVLWSFTPWLVITLISLLAIAIRIITPLIRRRYKLVVKREESSNVAAGYIADVISNIDTVKAFGREGFEAKNYRFRVKDFMNKTKASYYYQNLRINTIGSPLYVLINAVGLAIALAVSRNNPRTLEVVFVSFSYYASMSGIIWQFNEIYRRIETSFTDAAQFTELLLAEPRLKDVSKPIDFKISKGLVEFNNVTFRYNDAAGKHLFKDFNLRIESGEKVALVGHSGGGKTTVTRLLLRFMDLNSGQILIDGQNIAEARQSELRSGIAYVPQEPAMFHRSLADNIRYGRLDATDQDVKRAGKAAHATEFIDNLQDGYQTMVGERGIKLSGGQRQRIAIARAMIKDAPILVLDEATSALDSESEKLIQDALWKLMEGRTAIVIAHRLSTIQKMDRIIVLEEGKIIEQGSHKELIAKKGIYASLWAHQSGGFLED